MQPQRCRMHGAKLAVFLVIALPACAANAASGTWNVDAGGNWSDFTKWSGGTIADGADATANFTFNITSDRTVTLDSPRTIGNIAFDDTGAGGDSKWTIAGSNTIQLDVT